MHLCRWCVVGLETCDFNYLKSMADNEDDVKSIIYSHLSREVGVVDHANLIGLLESVMTAKLAKMFVGSGQGEITSKSFGEKFDQASESI